MTMRVGRAPGHRDGHAPGLRRGRLRPVISITGNAAMLRFSRAICAPVVRATAAEGLTMTLFRHGLLLLPALLLLVETAPSAAFEPSLSASCKALWEAGAEAQQGHRGQMIDCLVEGIEASHPSPAQID